MSNINNYGSFTSISHYFDQPIDIDYYWKFLIILGTYYILPSLQFVLYQSNDITNTTCYYNNKCKHDFYFIPAFNNVISNILYIIFGLAFIITVRLTHKKDTESLDYAISNHPSLYYSMGICLIFEGICSAIFHICPSLLNFQFDTTFMFLGTIVTFMTIYQKRHKCPAPMKIYCLASLLIFINILPLSGLSRGFEIWFWGGIFLIMAYIMIFGSIHLYYEEQYDVDLFNLKKICNGQRNINKIHFPKLILIFMLNTFTLGMYIFATFTKPNFTDWLLGVCIINLVIYFTYYLGLKIKNRESVGILLWIWMLIDIIIMSLSIVFFLIAVTDKFSSMEESNKLNKPCVLLNYFDYHDIWHVLSSIGLFIFMNIIYFMDNNLKDRVQVF